MKEDKDIKQLFDNYEPSLTPETDFIRQLQTNIKAVEAVRQSCAKEKLKIRSVMLLSALCGFAAGLLAWFLTPVLYAQFTDLIVRYLKGISLPDPALVRYLLLAVASTVTVGLTFRALWHNKMAKSRINTSIP